MRTHGVPSFPDPPAGGGINPQSPAFKAGSQACAQLAPGGGHYGVQATESQFLAAIRFAKCMRQHSITRFPDPTRIDGPQGPILIVGPGLFFHVSPNFTRTPPRSSGQ